jgi:hypothetical protein
MATGPILLKPPLPAVLSEAPASARAASVMSVLCVRLICGTIGAVTVGLPTTALCSSGLQLPPGQSMGGGPLPLAAPRSGTGMGLLLRLPLSASAEHPAC